jgi:APA family basic amino acid/polyamine antiporter
MPRPFMMRGNVWIRGRLIPVTAVAGAVTAFAAWVIALGTHPGARDVGVLWMIAGLGVYTMVRVRAGVPLMERYEPGAPPPEEAVELPSGPIVVPLEEPGELAEEVTATACRLATETGAPVVAVSAIYVPVQDPLDVELPERDRQVAEVQEMARSLASDYGIEFRGVVVRTRNPGRAIVDAVIDQGATLIVIGSPEKRRLAVNRQEAFFGRTVDFVLRKAPCRVIVTHFPSEEAVEAAHAVPVP